MILRGRAAFLLTRTTRAYLRVLLVREKVQYRPFSFLVNTPRANAKRSRVDSVEGSRIKRYWEGANG
jgi:hypothetical protein